MCLKGAAVSNLVNCTLSGNKANNQGGSIFHQDEATLDIENSILWGNSSEIEGTGLAVNISNSIVEGGITGNSIFDLNPLFVDEPEFNQAPTLAGDLRLQPCSPAIEAGNDMAIGLGLISEDLDGDHRFYDAIPTIPKDIDLGAYEYQSDYPAPVATCVPSPMAIDLGTAHQVNLAIADFDAGSSGGCNGLTLLINGQTGLSFGCDDVGEHSIVLSATDANQKVANCEVELTINGYVNVQDITIVHESCQGMADGTINVDATTQGGTLYYSIDGGVNLQAFHVFNNLTPGIYQVVVLAQGSSACQHEESVTINPGGTSQTWYKDIDNDGYSDGVTHTSCAQPTGYKAFGSLFGPETDCNDNDALQKPGQVWYPDLDADGYGEMTPVIQCMRPVGHKTIAELTGPEIDCDDSNPAVNPAATEICNGLDDNCNGQIDEGMSGGLTWTGNVLFSTQQQVDDWLSCYSIIDGNLMIQGAGINNLGPLINLVEITGNLTIQSTGLTSMTGLDNLGNLGGTLFIYFNGSLSSLNGLDALATVGGSFYMYYNFQLADCCAVHGLINGGVTGTILIFFNKAGCNSVADINNICDPAPTIGDQGTSITADAFPTALQEVAVFPNPTNGAFTVVLPASFKQGNLTLVDIHGRVVLKQEVVDGQRVYQLDGGQHPPGIYLVMVKGPAYPSQIKRLVIE